MSADIIKAAAREEPGQLLPDRADQARGFRSAVLKVIQQSAAH